MISILFGSRPNCVTLVAGIVGATAAVLHTHTQHRTAPREYECATQAVTTHQAQKNIIFYIGILVVRKYDLLLFLSTGWLWPRQNMAWRSGRNAEKEEERAPIGTGYRYRTPLLPVEYARARVQQNTKFVYKLQLWCGVAWAGNNRLFQFRGAKRVLDLFIYFFYDFYFFIRDVDGWSIDSIYCNL